MSTFGIKPYSQWTKSVLIMKVLGLLSWVCVNNDVQLKFISEINRIFLNKKKRREIEVV